MRYDLPLTAYRDLCEAINNADNAGCFNNNRSILDRDNIRTTIWLEMEDAYNTYRNGTPDPKTEAPSHDPEEHDLAYEHTLEWLSDNIDYELETALENN